jgi:NAD(P)-dependent dehydrogenase (short-subunit alcohol dehydrogenase family)
VQTVKDEKLRQQLTDPSTFDEGTLDKLAEQYKEVCRGGDKSVSAGYGSPYTFSKVLANASSRLLAQRLASRPHGSTVYVNNANPGVVDTGMHAKFRASVDDATFAELKTIFAEMQNLKVEESKPGTPADGADTPVWLALYPPGGPTGRFWFARRELSYVHGDA